MTAWQVAKPPNINAHISFLMVRLAIKYYGMTISFDDNVTLHGMKATHERFLHPPIVIISPVQLQQPPQPLHYFLYNIFLAPSAKRMETAEQTEAIQIHLHSKISYYQ